MKSKTRKIKVENHEFQWAVTEVEWDRVLLKIWVSGIKTCPWITIHYDFHNPWYLIGLVNEENIDKFQFAPVTPGKVAEIIKLALDQYGYPGQQVEQHNVDLKKGKLIKC